jgi:hypothetical protein
MSKSFDEQWERDREKEPTWNGPTRPIIPLAYAGAVKTHIGGTSKCSRCSTPTAGLTCRECQRRARLSLRFGATVCVHCNEMECVCEVGK